MKTNGENSVAYYHAYRYSLHSASINKHTLKMNGARRVIIFCLLTAVLPTILIVIPLYLRHSVFKDAIYELSETDILEIGGDISTIFCQEHTIKMNTSFNAYQMNKKPDISNTRKHIRLKKSMKVPDDAIEFWGFFLLRGSIVRLSFCSRYDGAKFIVVKGEKKLKTCGIMDAAEKRDDELNKKKNVHIDNHVDDKDVIDDTVLMESNNDQLEDIVSRKNRAAIDLDQDENTAAEDTSSDGLKTFLFVSNIAKQIVENSTESSPLLRTWEETLLGHRLRHSRSRSGAGNTWDDIEAVRRRRTMPDSYKVENSMKIDEDESSASSFETELLQCYEKDQHYIRDIPPLKQCHDVSYLLHNHTGPLINIRNITDDGYYYYIFYSDNDLVENDIYAIFDVYKPTYQFADIDKKCINETTCKFPVSLFSDDIFIVEMPTDDGIEHNELNTFTLISVCHPRMSVYIIFPLLVLILILGCSFL